MLYGQDPIIRYDQTRNAVEAIKRKILHEYNINTGYLESCGASAFSTLMEGLGYLTEKDYFRFPCGETIQMDDAHMIWLNDDNRGKYYFEMDNRYPDPYIDMARECYGCPAYIAQGASFDNTVFLIGDGHGVQLCLKSPGHWIAVIDYDSRTGDLIFHDSWGNRPGLKNNGLFEHMGRADWANVQPGTVIVYPRKER